MARVKKVADIEHEVEAMTLEAVLRERGIPHVMRTYHDSAYDGLFQAAKGAWGCVQAEDAVAGQVLAAIGEIRNNAEEAEEEER